MRWVGMLLGLCALGACDRPTAKAPVTVAINLPVTRFVLANGLEVIVQEDHRTPRVAINLRYHVGYKDDPPGRAGLAHLVEHLQFAHSYYVRFDSFFGTMHDLGAQAINGTTDADATSYFETVPATSLDAALWIEADRMSSAVQVAYDDKTITREKNVVGQELRLRYRNEPNGYRYQLLSRAVYPEGHPYRRSLDEEAQERAATAAEIGAFAKEHYTPDNATLVLVGDVSPDDARAIATRNFASIAPCPDCRATRQVPPVEVAALKRMRVVADVDTPLVMIAWPLPAPTDDGFYEAPFALAEIDAGARGFTDDAEQNHHSMRPGSVTWTQPHGGRLGTVGAIYGVPSQQGSAEDLVDAVGISRSHILANEWAQLGSQRSSVIAREIRSVEELADRASTMQDALERFGDPSYVMKFLHNVQGVTAAREIAAVDRFFGLDRAAVIVVTPDPNAPRGGKVVEEVRR